MSGVAFAPDRWRRIEELFHSTIELPESQRLDYLRDQCGADDQLRQEIESLLKADYQESPLIAGIVDDATNSLMLEDEPT
jgi:hypothetical protein